MASDHPRPLRLDNLGPASQGFSSSALLSPRTPTTPSSLKGNPLTSKVSSVLSASYADSEFRDSLSLLDDRHIQNNAETRRRLRLDVQKEVIDSNGEIIAEFGRVAEQLRRIGNTIGKLNKTYDDMKTQVTAAHKATEPMLQEATSLIERRRNVETRRKLLNAFVGHFVLAEDEVAALTLTAEPVDERFFAVLAKAKKISKDCEILLGFEDNQSLGLEIMEQTSKNINLGFQKLYKWVQREFKNLNLENPQIGLAMNRALRVLAERPSLFQSCLDSFAEARESILSDAFYVALTGSSDGGGYDGQMMPPVKPIELAAHDPLRYSGDMLAWTHSATVSEREALESLFVADGGELAKGIKEGRENEMWRLASDEGQVDEDAFDPIKALNDLVDRDLSGVARILRQRMEQVLQTNEETILAYKIANLLNFYRVTFAKLLGSVGAESSGDNDGSNQSSLVETLGGLETEALRHFRSLIRDHVATLRNDFEQAPADSAPPEFLQDALEQLMAIMKTYDTSLSSSQSREADFVPILAEALDPYLVGCEDMARKVTEDRLGGLIFWVNCMAVAREALAGYDFTSTRAARLQADIDSKARALAESQYTFFCQQSGLGDIFTALHPLTASRTEDVQAAVKLELLQPEALVQASQFLDDFLPSALMDAIENLKPLQDPKLARRLTEEAAERFCINFEHVEEILDAADKLLLEQDADRDPDTALRVLFPRTTVEIRVLLS